MYCRALTKREMTVPYVVESMAHPLSAILRYTRSASPGCEDLPRAWMMVLYVTWSGTHPGVAAMRSIHWMARSCLSPLQMVSV